MIPKELSQKINLMTTDLQITLFNFLLAGYCAFLSKVSNQQDFVIDSPFSTRDSEDHSKLIGWMTGVLVSRIKVEPGMSFKDLLFFCKKNIIESIDHIDYSLYWNHIRVEWNQVATQINLINNNTTIHQKSPHIGDQHYDSQDIYFDIAFTLTVFENGILAVCKYKTEAIHPSIISLFCEKFVDTLRMGIDFPENKIKNWNFDSYTGK